MKQPVEFVVYDETQDGTVEDWPPKDAAGALAWLSGKIAEIPAEFAASVTVEFHGASAPYDNDLYPQIVIAYSRPETDAEQSHREAHEAKIEAVWAETEKKRELAELARLKAKYPEA